MSLLLDALNKADQERKRNEATPGINSNHDPAHMHNERTLSVPVIVTLIVVALIVLLSSVYWLGQHTPAAPIANTASTQPTAAIQNTEKKSTASQQPQQAAPAEKNQPSATSGTAAPTQEAKSSSDQNENPAEENVANLYQQNSEELASTPPPSATNKTANAATDGTPGKLSSVAQFANLPEISDLPNNVLEKLPSLNYTEHHYNANGGSVVINGSVKHVNDQLANGLVIDKILEDGMVLHFDNYIFKMRALNSWVNM